MTAWLAVDGLAACGIALLGAFVLHRRPPEPLWPALPLFHLFALLYVGGDAMTQVATSAAAETLGITLLYSGTIPLAATSWLIALRYAEAEARPFDVPRSLAFVVPLVWALLTWGLMVTNPWHGLYLTPVIGGRNVYHLAWWISAGVGYAWMTGAVALMGALAWRARQRGVRRNALLMMLAVALPVLGHWAYVLWPTPLPVDPLALGLCAACGLLLLGVYRTRLFHLLPASWSEIVRHDPNGLLIADGDGCIVHANPAARTLLGLDELPDLGLFELLSASLREVGAAGAPVAAGALEARLGGASAPADEPVFLIDGPERRVVRLEASRVPGRSGEASALCVRLCDVTEAWWEREERRASEERYRGLVAHAPLGVLACERDGRILVTNARLAKILGEPRADLTAGANLFEIPALREAGIAALFERCLSRGEGLVEEISAEVPALGGRLEARFHLEPLRDAGGHVTGVQSLVEDLRVERRLEAVSVAAGGVVHDFRNLLHTIVSQTELLVADGAISMPREPLDRLQQAARHASELVGRLLDPPVDGAAESRADLLDAIREVVHLVAGELPWGVRLELELSHPLPHVPVPPPKLRQVLSNLLLNGAEAMRGWGGVLRVEAARHHLAPGELAGCAVSSTLSGPAVVVRVRDEGAGIDPDDLAAVFTPFFSRRQGGTGLGLATVAHVVRTRGGAVRVESRPGYGTTFTVYLPEAGAATSATSNASSTGR